MATVDEILNASGHPPINLDQLREAIAAERSIEIEQGGRTFHVRPIELMSDEETRALRDTDDEVEAARLMMDDYDGFVEAGGNVVLLGMILDARSGQVLRRQGVTEGESAASSVS